MGVDPDEVNIVFPASAGMIPWRSGSRPLRSCVPRKRGDDPIKAYLHSTEKMCSPQARG